MKYNLVMQSVIIQSAPVVSGAGRGRRIGIPTINVEPASAPKELTHGIYACFIFIDGKKYKGAMHFGPRPVFRDTETLEVHVLDATIETLPKTVDIEIAGRIRDIADFQSVEALQKAIAADIKTTRAMLNTHEEASEKHRS